MNSFNRKRIDVRLTLANKAFPNQQDANTLDLKGFQVLLDIKQVTSTSDQGNKAQIKIYGMKREDMNALSILVWEEQQVQHNKIVVFAGSEDSAQGGGMSEVFSGDITNAWADYSSSPEVCLTIDAIPMHYSRIMQAPATSYPNGVDVATAMQDLASKMGLGFVNNGVNIKLSSTYFASTLMRQVEQIAKQADILLLIQNQTMTISPKGSPLAGEIPFIHPGSGLVGYPTYHKNGIKFKCLYNPAIKLQGLIRVEDGLDIAKGEWLVKALDYQLESEKPDGAWFCQVDAARHSHGNTTK